MALIDHQSRVGNDVENLHPTYGNEAISHVSDNLEEELDEWDPLRAGLFDSASERAGKLLDKLEEAVRW